MKTPDIEAIAREIVDNLNGQDTGELTALQDSKDHEIDEVLAKHGIPRTDFVDEKLMDIICYADPFITEADAKIAGAGKDMLEALKLAADTIKTARKYFPKMVNNPDRFALELTCAAIGKAVHKAEVE